MKLCEKMAAMATPEMISDVGSGALMAHAGIKAAIYNVRTNLPNISDEAFDKDVRGKLDGFLQEADEAARGGGEVRGGGAGGCQESPTDRTLFGIRQRLAEWPGRHNAERRRRLRRGA